ncbi:MAG: type II secretion system F family protein [Alphaproteobacteria bacterium]|jgi:tight adherence protein C|nr:type II secretion system F family protein [Alphaproteobacteria bacterium]MBP7729110.1 type II secretion system F family protein [Alphaproteobacteria bacterium]
MFEGIDFLTFILALIVLLLSSFYLSKLRQKDVFNDRIKDLMRYKEHLVQEESTRKKIYRGAEDPSLPWLKKLINKIQRAGKEEQASLKNLFIKAGLRSDNASFLYGLAKMAMIFPPAIVTTIFVFYFVEWNVLFKILAIITSCLLGSYSVDFVLQRIINARRNRIRKAFPEALDLMVICTEAGLGLAPTIQRVAREISQIAPDLGYELAILSIELSMFSDRRKALQNFSNRMDSPYFKSIVTNVMQAEQYGTPIAQTMRVIAEQFRQDRLVEAEEKAVKLPVLMSLPMMLLIFPCIYIAILGPAVIQVLATFH